MLAGSVALLNATVKMLLLCIKVYDQLLSYLKLTHFNKVLKNFKYAQCSHSILKYPCMNPSGVFFYSELWYLKLVTLPSNSSAVNLKLFVGYKKTPAVWLCGMELLCSLSFQENSIANQYAFHYILNVR